MTMLEDPTAVPAAPAADTEAPAPSRREAARTAVDATTRKARAAWAWLIAWVGDGKSTTMTRTGVPLWKTAPPTLFELYTWTATGRWVEGDRHPILEAAGKAYGYLLVLPLTFVGYGGLYLLQRPGRLFLAALGLAAIKLSYSLV